MTSFRTWSWHDLTMTLKRDCKKVLVAQVVVVVVVVVIVVVVVVVVVVVLFVNQKNFENPKTTSKKTKERLKLQKTKIPSEPSIEIIFKNLQKNLPYSTRPLNFPQKPLPKIPQNPPKNPTKPP